MHSIHLLRAARYVSRHALATATPATVMLLMPAMVFAQASAAPGSPGAPSTLPSVVVTATRIATPTFDVPASIDRIGGDAIRDGRAQVNISESLGGVPGLLARDRQNYAQDVQISVRGFGARSTFGIRGVRMYVDGIPATFPDGQGQITNVDLGSVERIEVLRGPFSALYGNSSGGVLQVFTEEGNGRTTLELGVSGGSNGSLRLGAKASGSNGSFGYVVGASHFETDGYRDHSAAERNIGNAKLTLRPDDASKLTLIVNTVSLPKAQDPLGLSRPDFDTAPKKATLAEQFDTRKTVHQTQGGLIYERRIDATNELRAMVYTGRRTNEQYQSIPVGTQGAPSSPGGVIALASNYSGTDLRWTARTNLADRPFTMVAGVAYDTLDQDRRGYLNFTGTGASQVLGVKGALRRDETSTVSNIDEYLQASWQITPEWSVNAGLRHSSVRFDTQDHYIVGTNGDDSGAARYNATLPVLGVMYAVNSDLHLYATVGRGFETPTLNELAYRPFGASGLNFGLQPARSNSGEVGLKAGIDGLGDVTAAVFQTRTSNEIVTLTNSGGRSTYQNAGATRRTGLELGWSKSINEDLRAQAAFTWLDASYHDSFKTCGPAPCNTPALTIPAGNRIPGIARSSLYAALNWTPPLGWRGGIEGRYLSRVYVNDANSDSAAGYAIASVNAGYVVQLGAWRVTGFARADNLFDRKYAGSVIVNEGNSRFFEPAPGRTWLAGLSGSVTF
ncbi:TonB-dependent receptor [soil metagenome]